MRPPAPRRANGLLLAGVGRAENRRNLRKDLAEAGRHARHNCAGRDGNKTRHQSVLDEVLAALIFPNLELQKQILHFVTLSPLPMVRDSPLSPTQKYHWRVAERIGINPNAEAEISSEH